MSWIKASVIRRKLDYAGLPPYKHPLIIFIRKHCISNFKKCVESLIATPLSEKHILRRRGSHVVISVNVHLLN